MFTKGMKKPNYLSNIQKDIINLLTLIEFDLTTRVIARRIKVDVEQTRRSLRNLRNRGKVKSYYLSGNRQLLCWRLVKEDRPLNWDRVR